MSQQIHSFIDSRVALNIRFRSDAKNRPREESVIRKYHYACASGCAIIMGVIWSVLFGTRYYINNDSYKLVRRIGEGGELDTPCMFCHVLSRESKHQYVQWLIKAEGRFCQRV